MKEYIERDAAIRTAIQAVVAYSLQITGNGITQFDGVDVANRMEMIPTADVVKRVRGEWVSHEGYEECNVCHTKAMFDYNYCPNCGADMREVDHV